MASKMARRTLLPRQPGVRAPIKVDRPKKRIRAPKPRKRGNTVPLAPKHLALLAPCTVCGQQKPWSDRVIPEPVCSFCAAEGHRRDYYPVQIREADGCKERMDEAKAAELKGLFIQYTKPVLADNALLCSVGTCVGTCLGKDLSKMGSGKVQTGTIGGVL